MNNMKKVIFGVDQLNDYKEEYALKRVGLLTTGAAVDRHLNTTLQIVNNVFDLTSLFAAEYGVMGEKGSNERFSTYQDIWTGLTVFSLFRYGTFHLSREMLASFDVLFVDLPISGTRYDSYIPTIHRLLRQLGEAGKEIVILDRPNPLGAAKVEGPVLRDTYKQDEDEVAIPIRHGLTLGELAMMMNAEDQLNADLKVIQVRNWERAETTSETDRPWFSPNNNHPNIEACLLSVGLELLNGTNISIGYGTSLPYQIVGAPFLDAIQLAANLNKTHQAGVQFTPIYFEPSIGIYQGTRCQGVKINITNSSKLKPFRLAITIISELKRLAGDDMIFNVNGSNGQLEIDYLYGNSRLSRQYAEVNDLVREAQREADTFLAKSKEYHLYE